MAQLKDTVISGNLRVTDKIYGQHKGDTFYVKGTQTANTGSWTGNLPEVDALYEGLAIDYWLPFAGSGNATLNLTLKDGTTTGAINCYFTSNNRLTTHMPQYSIIRMIYQTVTISGTSYTGWWPVKGYDSNDNAVYMFRLGSFIANSVVYRYQFLFGIDDYTLTPLNNVDNNTGTSKTLLTNVEFDPLGFIFFWNTTTTVSANGTMNGWNWFREAGICDMRFTFNCGQTLTTNKAVYLKTVLQSSGKVKLATGDPLVYTLPSTNDGYMYIYLGRTYSNYQIDLDHKHPVYYHDGTTLRQFVKPDVATTSFPGLMSASDKSKLDGIASGAKAYTGSDGITLTGTNFTNSGVRSVATGGTNGTISVNTNGTAAEVAVKGLGSAAYTASTAYAAASHTHDPQNINEGYLEKRVYLNTHPEANGVIIPFINNDIAFLEKIGGSYSFYTTSATDYTTATITNTGDKTGISLTNVFDGSPTYTTNLTVSATTEKSVIEIVLPRDFYHATVFYIDFGNSGWRAKEIHFLGRNTNKSETTWTEIGSITGNALGHWYQSYNRGSTGINQIRLVLTDWATTTPRIAQIGLVNYNSPGVNQTFMSRGVESDVLRNITPSVTETYSLGTSSKKWKDVYTKTINGTNVTTTSIGSASAGTAIDADDITSWSAGTLGSATYDSETETLEFAFGSLPSLSYTAKSIPNISVTSKTAFVSS